MCLAASRERVCGPRIIVNRDLDILILAAGLGTRMRSNCGADSRTISALPSGKTDITACVFGLDVKRSAGAVELTD